MRMLSDFNTLNRSHSESDIYIAQFDNLTVNPSGKNLIKTSHNSCSSIVRRVYIEEVFSCDGKQIRNMFNTIDDVKHVPSITKQKENYVIMQDEKGIEEVPMDVDSSFSEERFPKIMGTNELNSLPRLRKVNVFELDETADCDSVQTKEEPEQTIKPRVIHINPVKRRYNWNTQMLVLFIIICIVCLFSFTNIINNFIVNNETQLENIKNDLESNIHGHSHLVDSLINILGQRASWANKLQIISFIGSQGVGKTFFAGLLKKHFPNQLSHDIYGTHLLYNYQKQKVIDAIDDCCLNLIVIDDLKQTDTVELFAFAHSLPKDSFILLIAIFNTHYSHNTLNTVVNYSDIIEIRDNFEDSGIKNYEFFVFQDFTYDQIKDWIKKTLDSKKVPLSEHEEISQNILSTHDVKHGLKGLHSRILLELEKHRK